MSGPVAHLVLRLDAKRSGRGWIAKCPAHDDRKPSLSISEGNDGRVLLKCLAGCDTNDVLAALGMAWPDLFPTTYPRPSGNGATSSSKPASPLDWQQCVSAVKPRDLVMLGNERWYSRQFCAWLHDKKYVGLFHGDFAFPVQDDGNILAAHYRVKATRVGEKDDWFYFPTGIGARPFVIGDLTKAKQAHIGESQWDMLALADRTDLYLNENHAFIATRGAGNAALCNGLIPKGVSILAWPQNDEAGMRWLDDLSTKVPVQGARAIVPEQFKDVNEWTKAGATAEDIYTAIF